ncbi:hypothetical protein Pmani_034437 [Petrolisthes manimaculis]|uniref:Uncharacterized protein n=1 Tax=Petrolisthes manimaculis TaxID=1843537 RepID=A0AAE1TRL5_9EUCA|nr:hypothetical protein Pmani_034437 [Petrolisthes manimaculis]
MVDKERRGGKDERRGGKEEAQNHVSPLALTPEPRLTLLALTPESPITLSPHPRTNHHPQPSPENHHHLSPLSHSSPLYVLITLSPCTARGRGGPKGRQGQVDGGRGAEGGRGSHWDKRGCGGGEI